MQFTRLRLTGFKSFVEPTELLIEPGMTGVVGPNGCGKSNIVEALRWVMGETSAKSMRGGAMDDVIFAGTALRPARNVAEVVLHLDNSERRAPAAFNDSAELEIGRRIERASGSNYRVNGREVRAKDVQLLFADAATGAHSTAMVSQGRVGQLINARPNDRRLLIEEAAGITGLASRRHEAELRLKAAETNLERLDDVMMGLETQLQGLRRQARQATRYRNLSGHIRRAEATLLHLKYIAAKGTAEEAEAALTQAAAKVGELAAAATVAAKAQAEAGLALPPLRQTAAEAGAALHRLTVAREALDAEETRLREAEAEAKARLTQIADDRAREDGLLRDAGTAVQALDQEHTEVEAAREGEAETNDAAEQRLSAAEAEVAAKQQELDQLMASRATEAAQRRELDQALRDTAQRLERLAGRLNEIAEERGRLEGEAETPGLSEDIEAEIAAAAATAEQTDRAAEAAEQARRDAQAAETEARDQLQARETETGKLRAEAEALAALLVVDGEGEWPPLVDAVTVTPGYEQALGAALGDDLNGATDNAAPVHWSALTPYDIAPPLPPGTISLAELVQAPPLLSRRLSQIGVVDPLEGGSLQAELRPGQRLVSRDGDLWRWDGFTAKAGAATSAATRLAQRNRLDEVQAQLTKAEAALQSARDTFETARQAVAGAGEEERASRAAARAAAEVLTKARAEQVRLVQANTDRMSRLSALTEAAAQVASDRDEAEVKRDQIEAQRQALPAEDAGEAELAAIRVDLENLRGAFLEARHARDQLRRDAEGRAARLQAIDRERQSWADRAQAAEAHLAALADRKSAAEQSLASLADRPLEIKRERAALFHQIEAAESKQSEAADAVAVAERTQADCDRAAQDAQAALAEAREIRVRAEADAEHAGEIVAQVVAAVHETLECTPDQVLEAAEIKDGDELPTLDATAMRLERLKRERDNMGPVNLRADIEAAEVQEQLDTLIQERADLEKAIARLRQGISSLNSEARQRLLAAFQKVDEHFQEVFVRVFGGGRAHLKLTDSDDPLEAGLEIMASPPGKRLQVLSLLSGGEQALTALSLLFAVFLTNPAPICVLDEVDAPLDDANVNRFCKLVEDIARNNVTRFLVVTHHPLTMSRMDRLFGVTMAERGVSQLVSVDLQTAEELRETA